MPRLDDFLNGYAPDAENFDYEAFKAEALKAYTEDRGVWDAKVGQVTEERDTAAKKVTELQAHNYDLLMATGAKVPDPNSPGAGDDGGTDDGPADPIQSLFKKD